jgi:hypothetical protein
MPIQNKLVAGIDLPVYEFLRPTNYNNGANTASFFNVPGGKNRYMYTWQAAEGLMYRYDTYADATLRMPGSPRQNNSLGSLAYLNKGYCGSVISSSVSGIDIAAYDGNQAFVGKTIRITKGPGKNQERTILSVSNPVVAERMVLTGVTNNQGGNAGTVVFTDTLRSMSANQYEGFECKVVFGTGYGQIRRILYNTNNSITLSDPSLAGVLYNHSPVLATNPAANSVVLIQSSNLTVDTPWIVQPTSDSQFEILNSGGKLLHMYNVDSPFAFFEYDLATMIIDYKTIYGIQTSQFSTDYDICGGYQSDTPSVSAFVTSASSLFFADSANAFPDETYNNYQVKIVSGKGQGQIRHITSTALSGYTTDIPWDVIPDQTSVYVINNNDRIVYSMGNFNSRIYNYHSEYDVWSHHPYVAEYGVVNTAYATSTAFEFPIPISTITRTVNQAVVTTTRPHLLNTNLQTVTLNISGATDPLYNGTFSVSASPFNANIFQYIMGGTPSANATFGYTNTTTRIFDATKAWTTNQWVSSICYIFNTQTTQFPTQRARFITANDRNSLTFAGALDFTPSNGCRYFIFPPSVMGTDRMEGLSSTKLSYGKCTTSNAGGVTDSSRNWQTNVHVNKRLLIVAGTGAGTEATITANTATAITASGISTDTTSVYVILGALPMFQAGMILEYAYNTTNDKGRYLYFNRGGTTPMFGQRYNVSTQAWETEAYPLFYSNSPAQNNSTWPYSTANGGQCSVYDGNDRIYFNPGSNQRNIFYMDLRDMSLHMAGFYPYGNSNNGYTGARHFGLLNVDGVKFIYMHRCGGTFDIYRFTPPY